MSEIRYDALSGRPVVIAPDRSLRPNEYGTPPEESDSPRDCPFCEGHEARTPAELRAVRPSGVPANRPGWSVRVIPNKFPTLAPGFEGSASRNADLLRVEAGRGAHEVVIESPRHAPLLPNLPAEQVRVVFGVLRERVRLHTADPQVAAVLTFENVGPESGGTLWHPHSQVVAMPIIPPRLGGELAVLGRAGSSAGSCRLESWLAAEMADGRRRVAETPAFRVVCPFASEFPYAIRIAPRRHVASLGDLTDPELGELAVVLSRILRSLRAIVAHPSYNWYGTSMPPATRSPGYHWRLDVAPRLVRPDGFDLGTEVPVNPVAPEEAAAQLRAAWDRAPEGGTAGGD